MCFSSGLSISSGRLPGISTGIVLLSDTLQGVSVGGELSTRGFSAGAGSYVRGTVGFVQLVAFGGLLALGGSMTTIRPVYMPMAQLYL
jgi:hypothetical protein